MDFPEDAAEIVARVVYYLYTGEYSATITDEVLALLGIGGGSEKAPKTDSKAGLPQENNLSDNEPSQKKTEKEQKDKEHSTWLIENIKVDILTYQCADKLDIVDLRKGCMDSFQAGLTQYGQDLGGLAEIISLAYESTSARDEELRPYVTQQCVTHHKSVLQDSELVKVIKMHELVAWNLALAFQVSHDQLQQQFDLREQLLATRDKELAQSKEKCLALKQTSETDAAHISNLTDQLRKIVKDSTGKALTTTMEALVKYCPHCGGHDFLAIIVNWEGCSTITDAKLLTECAACGKKWSFTAAE